jgi:adenylate cyclase
LDELLRRDPERPLNLGGERRQVCVLFADVRNFTGFAETHTPEQVIEAVNRYMTALTHVLHAHRGILDKYTGDGLMALFRDDALAATALVGEHERRRALVTQAVQAALDMQAAVQNLSRERAAENLPALGVGIGLHFGEAVVGLVGNPVHIINYTALGHAVVVAARLQGVAGPGEVVVSETVHQVVAGRFTVEARDPIPVKGLSVPVRPYRVLAAAPTKEQS